MPPCERLRMLVSKTIPLARGRNGILFLQKLAFLVTLVNHSSAQVWTKWLRKSLHLSPTYTIVINTLWCQQLSFSPMELL